MACSKRRQPHALPTEPASEDAPGHSVLSAPVPPYWPGIEGTGCPSHAHHTSPQTGDWAGGFPAAWGQERLRSLKMPPRQVPALPAQPLMGSPLPTCPPGQMECRSVGQSQLLPTSDLRPTPPSVRGCEQHPTAGRGCAGDPHCPLSNHWGCSVPRGVSGPPSIKGSGGHALPRPSGPKPRATFQKLKSKHHTSRA